MVFLFYLHLRCHDPTNQYLCANMFIDLCLIPWNNRFGPYSTELVCISNQFFKLFNTFKSLGSCLNSERWHLLWYTFESQSLSLSNLYKRNWSYCNEKLWLSFSNHSFCINHSLTFIPDTLVRAQGHLFIYLNTSLSHSAATMY